MIKSLFYAFLVLFSSLLIADDAIDQAIKVLSPSTLSQQQMAAELKWFQQASTPFKGKQISVVSEDIPTHRWEKDVLALHFENITGIKVNMDIVGEGTVVENIFKQLTQGVHLYDIYINDADHISTHARVQGVVNLTQYMNNQGKRFTNPNLDLDDFLNLKFGQDHDGQQLQLPDQQFANLYWFRHDWFTRKDIKDQFLQFTEKNTEQAMAIHWGYLKTGPPMKTSPSFLPTRPLMEKKYMGTPILAKNPRL